MKMHPLIQKLKDAAEADGRPYIEISERAGYDSTHLGRIIRGVSRPSYTSLLNFFEELGYDLVAVKKEKK